MPVDVSMIPVPFSTTEKEGFYAEFHPNGQLAHFGFYRDGELLSQGISFDPEGNTGRVIKQLGHFESTPVNESEGWGQTSIEEWAFPTLQAIAEFDPDAKACSFCAKDQSEVRKLIPGPNNCYICDECIAVGSEIMARDTDFAGGYGSSPAS